MSRIMSRVTRKLTPTLACVGLLAALWIPSVSVAQPPAEWELLQNEPNPFCETAVIQFTVVVAAEITLQIWNPEETEIVRTLFQGAAAVGFYSVQWDQRNDAGDLLPNGAYPYELIALNPSDGSLLFTDKLTAVVDCPPTPASETTWSRIKSRYR